MTNVQYALEVKLKSCERKIWYRSRAKARKALGPSQSQLSKSGELVVYQCAFCNGWHLGGKIGPDRMRIIEWAARILEEAA